MPQLRIPHYIERATHFVNVQYILAYVKTEDTSVYREESTFRKILTNTRLCQKIGIAIQQAFWRPCLVRHIRLVLSI